MIAFFALTCFIDSAEGAKVRNVLLLILQYLLIGLAEAVWMNPLATGTLALEHAPAWTILFRVVRCATDAVDSLVVD